MRKRQQLPACEICNDLGFVRDAQDEVHPCPACNPDSGYEPGEYQAALIKQKGRCDYVKGGGGRVCIYQMGHKGVHVFQCGH